MVLPGMSGIAIEAESRFAVESFFGFGTCAPTRSAMLTKSGAHSMALLKRRTAMNIEFVG
jgi:hypothetical protein